MGNDNELMLDVGQANELKLAFRRAEWTNKEIKSLCEGDFLTQVRKVLLGHAEIKAIEHLIDCDADPFVPNDWSVVEHKKGGQFKWDPARVSLYLSKSQKNRKVIRGNHLCNELKDKLVLNANVLDYLLANPHLIPKEWKDKYVFFWGTIYRDPDGDLGVRYLSWGGGRWHWHWGWLDDDWLGDDWLGAYPAALLAS